MESRYGIGINNRYALFLDSEDGEDLILPKKKPVDAKTPAVPEPATKPVKKAAPEQKLKEKPAPNQNNRATKDTKPSNREDKENRNNRYEGKRVLDARKPQDGPRENREERNNRRNRPEGAPGPDGDSKRGGGRGGGMRGGRGGRGGGRGGKRDFDRKSGDDRTGVKPVDKKEGSGSHNWGTFEDEMKAEDDKANSSGEMNDSAVEATDANNAPNEVDEAKKAAEEEEAKTMTLDEWKAQQQAKKDQPKFNLRKAGEGSDFDPKWKKTYAYKKEKETHEDDEDDESEVYLQRANRQKKVLDIGFHFNDPNGPAGPERGGRGGRGGRGRGDRRGDRGERRGGDRPGGRGGFGGKPRGGKGSEAPNVNDEMSFPSLG